MKKILSLVLVCVMSVGVLAGCGSDSKEKESLSPQEQSKQAYEMVVKKNESMYAGILKKYKQACKSKDEKTMKSLSKGLAQMKSESDLDKKVGYTFRDFNSDGTEELIISKKTGDRADSYLLAVYMYGNNGPQKVIEGFDGYRCYLSKNSMIYVKSEGDKKGNEYSIVYPRYEGLEYTTMLKSVVKGGTETYYYNQVGKVKASKKFKVSKKKFDKVKKEWDDGYAIPDVELIKGYK